MTFSGQGQVYMQKVAQLEADELLHISGARRAWYEFRRNRFALVGSVFIIFIALMGILAPVVSTHDPYKQSLRKRMKPPSAEHYMGTDELGTRRIFAPRLWRARLAFRRHRGHNSRRHMRHDKLD